MAYTDIDKPEDYFNTKLYTGNNSTGHAITGVGFQPDWTWIKERSSTSSHFVNDSVRGAGKIMYTDLTAQEATNTSAFTSFDSDGFTIGNTNLGNQSGETYASWNWLAGGTASSNTDGSITSNVSASTTSGFSIVSYTGNGTDNATIGHGLGSSIDFVIVKRRNTTSNWLVQGSKVGTGYGQYLELNSTGTISTASDNIKSVSSSTLTLGTNGSCNGSSDTYIAYCFAEKKGFSKFGKYVGNNNDDGTFVYLGFKPAFLLIKIIDTQTDNWIMQDNKRNTSNLSTSQRLRANSSGAEFSSSNEIDLLSNGFKVHGADGEINGSGASYIYMAFAESPFTTSTGIPTTAR